MRKLLVVALIALALGACIGTPAAVKRSELQTAEITYVQASIGYEATMLTLQDLRSIVGPTGEPTVIKDDAWRMIAEAQSQVRRWQPVVRGSLEVWRVTKSKPGDYDAALQELLKALTTLQTKLAEAKNGNR